MLQLQEPGSIGIEAGADLPGRSRRGQYNPDLSGALIIQQTGRGRNSTFRFDVLAREVEGLELSLQFLDNDRLECLETLPTVPLTHAAEVADLANSAPWPVCALVRRATEVLDGPLRRGTCEAVIAENTLRQCEYVAITIGHQGLLTPSERDSGRDWRRGQDVFYLEFHKRKLNRGSQHAGTMFWLVTRRQATRRMNAILRQFPVLHRKTPETVQAVENITFAIYGGGDHALLTERMEDHE